MGIISVVFCLSICVFSSLSAQTNTPAILIYNNHQIGWRSVTLYPDSTLSVGDVITIEGTNLTYRRKDLDSIVPNNHDSGLFIYGWKNQTRLLIGLRIDKKTNPFFLKMNTHEINNLWGVTIEYWSNEIEEKLKSIDSKTYVTLGTVFTDHILESMPPIPDHIEYFAIEQSMSPALKEISNLKNLTNLKFLNIESLGLPDPFDLSLLSGFTKLQILSFNTYDSCYNVDALGNLSSLEVLRLNARYVQNIKPLRQLKKLRRVYLRRTPLSNLSDLADLPLLEHVNANSLPLSELPQKNFKSLKRLDVMGSTLSDSTVSMFQRMNPTCEVNFHWKPLFEKQFADADCLIIGVNGGGELPDYTINNSTKIHDIINHTDIIEEESVGFCMCIGTLQLNFYKRGRFIDDVSWHHGLSLRWSPWPADAYLTDESAMYYCMLFNEYGFKEAIEECEKLETEKRLSREFWRFFSHVIGDSNYSTFVNQYTNKQGVTFDGIMREIFPDSTNRWISYWKLFGYDSPDWSVYAAWEIFLRDIFEKTPESELMHHWELVKKDTLATRGFCRWLIENSDHEKLDKKWLFTHWRTLLFPYTQHSDFIIRRKTYGLIAKIQHSETHDFLMQLIRHDKNNKKFKRTNQKGSKPGGQVAYKGFPFIENDYYSVREPFYIAYLLSDAENVKIESLIKEISMKPDDEENLFLNWVKQSFKK